MSPRPHPSLAVRDGRPPWAAPLALLAVLALAAGCRRAPVDELPAGTLWSGDARAVRPLLGSLQALAQTPLPRAAQLLERKLAGCERFLAYCPPGAPCTLADSLSCRPAGDLARKAEAARGEASWLFVTGDGHRRLAAWGTATDSGAGVRVRALVHDDGEGPMAAWQALLPARRAAAAPVLADDHALVHLRLRSDRGVADLGRGAGAEWAADLYGLRAGLFAAMTLEGTAELAVYEPAPGVMIPPLALAVHVRRPAAAERAIEAIVARTNERWGATRSPWQVGPYRGACLADLNVLPGLAPCYVVTDRALVLGWNPLSVVVALLRRPTSGIDAAGSLAVYLDRFAAADARLRASWRSDPRPPNRYPWSLLAVTADKGLGGYQVDLRLAPAAARGPAVPTRSR